MTSDRDRLQTLIDALPDAEVQVAISFLAELGEQEILDAETAAKLDSARRYLWRKSGDCSAIIDVWPASQFGTWMIP